MADLAQAAAWHRQVAALACAADRAGVALVDLPAVRTRLLAQQSRLTAAATRTGAPLPALLPSPAEIATAGPALGDLSEAAIQQTVRTMLSTLDSVDAALGVPAPVPAGAGAPLPSPVLAPLPHLEPTHLEPRPPQLVAVPPRYGPPSPPATPGGTLRNAGIYAGFSFGVLVAQILLFYLLDENTQLPLFAPLCLPVLPAFAWLAGFLTIAVVFRTPPGAPSTPRNPRLGAVICAGSDLFLCFAVVALFVANRTA